MAHINKTKKKKRKRAQLERSSCMGTKMYFQKQGLLEILVGNNIKQKKGRKNILERTRFFPFFITGMFGG